MFNAIFERCNSFAQVWAWWLGMSILDAAIVLAVVSLLWLAVRRKAPPQLGYLLFLLVPLKLFIPLYVSVPQTFFAWAPKVASPSETRTEVESMGHDSTPATLPSAGIPRNAMAPPPEQQRTFDLPARTESRVKADDQFIPPAAGPKPSLRPSVEKRISPSVLTWLMFAWLLGILALLARLVHAQLRFRRITLRNASEADLALFSVDFGGLLQQMRIGQKVRILESDRISSPVVWGVFRATLILPAGMATSLTSKQLEWVLLHELAHVRRRDLAVNCFQRAAGILHFLNPSIWIANRAIDRLREYACDDMASVCAGISAVDSGEAFLGVMRYAASVQNRPETNLGGALGMFESTARASCFKRMTRLLDSNRRLIVTIRWGSLCLLLLTAAVVLPQIRAANSRPAGEIAGSGVKAEEQKEEKGRNDMESALRSSAVVASATPEDQNRIEGVVVDEDGHPLDGAQVRTALVLVEGSTTTAADGRFRLTLSSEFPVTPPLIAQSNDLARIGFSATKPLNMSIERAISKLSEAAPVRIVLKPARTIQVSVKNAERKPVSGASVEALGERVSFPGSTTDQQGRATIRLHPEAKILMIIALKNGAGFDYYENYRSKPAIEPDPLPETVSLTLAKPHRVRIRTVDTAGKPVPGVFVAPWTMQLPGKLNYVNFSGSSLAGQRSGPSGYCDFSWIPETASRVGFLEYVKGYSCPDQPFWDAKPSEQPVTFRLPKEGEVSGSVRFPDGKPAAGIVILGEGRGATNMYFRGATRTKADGTYTLSIHPNQSTIIAVADRDWAAASHTAVQLGEGGIREHLDFVLARGTRIHGSVTVGPNQKPAHEEMVTLIELGDALPAAARKFGHDRGNLVRWRQVDENGNYEFRVGQGEFTLHLPNTNADRDAISVNVADQKELIYNGAATRPAQMRVRGRVVNAADGKPVSGANVYGEGIGRSGYASVEARAGSDGLFTIDRASDTDDYGYYARAPEANLAGFKIVPSGKTEVTLELRPAATVVGYVYQADGRPATGQKVTALIDCDGKGPTNVNVNTLTGKDGHYRIPALAVGSRCSILAYEINGTYWPNEDLKLDKPGEIAHDVVLPGKEAVPAKAAELKSVKTPASAPPPGASNQTTPVDLTFTGAIRDETTNQPIPAATVVVRRVIVNASTGRRGEFMEETKHTTDQEGHFTFMIRKEHVTAQRNALNRWTFLEIDAAHPGFVERDFSGYCPNKILKIGEPGNRPFFENIRLRPGREITAVVAAPGGALLVGVPIESYDHSSDQSARGVFHQHRTDANGRFRMTIPKPGGAVLWIKPKDYAPAEVIVDDEAGGAARAEAQLGTAYSPQPSTAAEAPADGDALIIKEQREDLGTLTVRMGLMLAGEVVAENGKPVAHQLVHAYRVRDWRRPQRVLGSVSTTIERFAQTDEQGKVAFAPLPPGEYVVEPCESDKSSLAGDRYRKTPIQGVFYSLKTTLYAGAEPRPFLLKAMPTVRIVAQCYGSDGKKAASGGLEVFVYGLPKGGHDYWQTNATGQEGRFELLAPRGLENASLTVAMGDKESQRFRKSADAPLQANLNLGTLETDLTGIQIIRYVAPVLLVKPLEAGERPLDAAQVTGQYLDSALAEPIRFEKEKDGWHSNSLLLPDEKFTIAVTAQGFRPESRTISLAEGTMSELKIKLEPR